MGIIEFLKEEKFLVEAQFKDSLREYKRNAFEQLGKTNITVLYGMRGTGKTTLLAQKYFESEEKLGIHGEHLNIAGYTVKDLIPSLKNIITSGHLFIDEITKLKNWAEELKVLSDLYPKLKIIITGSSAVDLQEARRALARRAVFINLRPLTLNEFLEIRYKKKIVSFDPFSNDPFTNALKTELDTREKRIQIATIVSEYKQMNLPYLMEKPVSTLIDVVDRIIYEDIGGTGSFDESVINKFWMLLKLLAISDKTSLDNLSKELAIGKGTIIKMIEYLSKANVVTALYPYAFGTAKIRKEPKYLFSSSTIRSVILNTLGEKEREAGLSREDLFAMHIDKNELSYLKSGPDFIWKNTLFEIGGPSKTAIQFKDLNFKGKKYVVYESEQISNDNNILKLPFYIFLSYF